eukprot:Protomagalhaensia_sp_Gyna_25__1349@NODE_1678_length_1631_cov_37_841709_g507_i1_p2_GENE_NODE_1678_length_1631_cov_37_841709_g507_i1NODE_1678_length_1631_cov_37_841709_g507_i1_p2_ORF_typecomplete_len160_score24_97HIT/PF01230_23/9e24DcpS_C/PF11969_8/2_2e07GalP_UDP_tr_C/PF02744_17/0_00063GalP_UDP_tr_C/PF02744_17/1e04DUF4921/PF16268_5/0_0023DUF4921/PF16268_5/57CwfJ_C_1/PF04677_15/0_0016GAF_2/PF13185_6/0_066Baculo_helicase/PF04735_12/0_088_NODE_1678_length_1631_cov_37_841709_g507_i1141620
MVLQQQDGYLFWKWPIAADEVFCENETCFATVNLKPVRPGHTMIITKTVKHRFAELSSQEISDMSSLAERVIRLLVSHYNLDRGVTMAIQDGRDAGQTVNHLHLHILPEGPSAQLVATDAPISTTDAPDPVDTVIKPRQRSEMKQEAALYCELLLKMDS